MKKRDQNAKNTHHNKKSYYPDFDSEESEEDSHTRSSESESDSESSSYEEALMSSISKSKNTSPDKIALMRQIRPPIPVKTTTNANKPTERRIEFIRNVFDSGIKLKPMIDFDNPEIGSECERLHKKTLDVKEILESQNLTLRYVKSGTTGHTFKATSSVNKNVAYAMKVCAYPKLDEYGHLRNPKRPENAELRMLKLLSPFVQNMKTPHFVLPLYTFNTSITPFIHVPPKLVDLSDEKNEAYRKFIERCEEGEFEDLVSVLISEWANGGDLLDYIRKNYKELTLEKWTIIFFQVLFTLASLHRKFPSFRHNDMKVNNILVGLDNDKYSEAEYGYRMDNVKFNIPNIGIQIKIWDFDFSSIDGIIENNKVNSDWAKRKISISKRRNQYYDMHFFFNTLICEKFFPQFYHGGVPPEIISFIHRMVPEPCRSVHANNYIRKGGRILFKKEITTPYKVIMEDKLFSKYRVVC